MHTTAYAKVELESVHLVESLIQFGRTPFGRKFSSKARVGLKSGESVRMTVFNPSATPQMDFMDRLELAFAAKIRE